MTQATAAPRRLFIVEDHLIMRQSYVMLFNWSADIEVCGAVETAEEALREIPAARPELVLIDVSLPGMNGLQLVEVLRRQQPDLRLLVVTGHDEEHYAEAAIRAGADGFIRKGDTAALLQIVEATFRR